MAAFKSTDEYFAAQDDRVLDQLTKMRQILRDELPDAEECISYSMPAYRLKGKVLVYFAAAKNHIGFYPTPGPIEAYQKELRPYHTSKGAVQFPYDRELPEDLIRKMVRFRVQEVFPEK